MDFIKRAYLINSMMTIGQKISFKDCFSRFGHLFKNAYSVKSSMCHLQEIGIVIFMKEGSIAYVIKRRF